MIFPCMYVLVKATSRQKTAGRREVVKPIRTWSPRKAVDFEVRTFRGEALPHEAATTVSNGDVGTDSASSIQQQAVDTYIIVRKGLGSTILNERMDGTACNAWHCLPHPSYKDIIGNRERQREARPPMVGKTDLLPGARLSPASLPRAPYVPPIELQTQGTLPNQ